MSSLEEQFEKALMEITLSDSGKHLLEAEAVTECVVSGDNVTITLDLPADDSVRKSISDQVISRLESIDGISKVNIKMADQVDNGGHDHHHHAEPRGPQRPENPVYLRNYDHIIAVSSGKGGVGKSTVAVNLAITLAKMGQQVSLFDSDVYGPSVPIMMGMRSTKPRMNDRGIMVMEKYGISLMSIGNLIEESAATIWRGPIVHQVIDQMLRDTIWPGGNFMIIDLPPGTGDAQLTLSQVLEISGAVVVSTPQDVALLDAMKGIAMFEKVDVPILGLVENMSSFICPNCEHETPIFDKGNAEKASSQHNIPFLGSIPIELAVREGGDNGAPIATIDQETPSTLAFKHIANRVIEEVGKL